jgi:hypothetical protein
MHCTIYIPEHLFVRSPSFNDRSFQLRAHDRLEPLDSAAEHTTTVSTGARPAPAALLLCMLRRSPILRWQPQRDRSNAWNGGASPCILTNELHHQALAGFALIDQLFYEELFDVISGYEAPSQATRS